MRVLLDECVDRRLAREIAGHEVITVPDAGWASAKNGELLELAQKKFDVYWIPTCLLFLMWGMSESNKDGSILEYQK